MSGVGYPQLSAIIECADGGCTSPGDLAKAFAAGGVTAYRASEGKEVLLDYHGPVDNTVQDILRSACTYVGTSKLKKLSKRTTFIRVTQQLNEVFGPAPT